jgi:hypothetical protein
VACATLKDELNLVISENSISIPVKWVDSGLHAWPERLRVRITEIIDSLDEQYKTVLLLFGFCGNSLVGVKCDKTIVMPLVADCIPLFVGSKKRLSQDLAYTYFFTGGYFNSERTFMAEFEIMKERYGLKKAKYISKKMLAHYKRITIIDTGAYDIAETYDKIKSFADVMELPVNIINGDLQYIKNLVLGNWDTGFIVLKPGEEMTFEHSLLAGKSQV